MVPKIFLTGATGYIGGDALYSLVKAHPDYEYTLLVRNEERGKPVAAAYPQARIVYGTLDDVDIIEKEAAAADIVVHTADSADNVPSATAITKGLAAGHTAEKPGYYIHLCGTGILTWYDSDNKRYGQAPLPDQKYHDIDDIDRILSLPDTAIHRDVDKIVLGANSNSVKILIVGPPTIYGQGRGPVNQRSIQVPMLIEYTIKNGFAPIQAPGLTEWDNVHIHDLGDFFVLAVDTALDPSKNSNPEIFGPKGYFFLENGVHRWADVSRAIALETFRQKLIPESIAKEIDYPNFGTNSKSVAARAKKYLGWTPKSPSLPDELPAAVTFEAKKLGKP
ncbi:NAD(P)-binding protein [Annulohypoxylon bovei var. microspora]|nr:NAD(P)-binding protein [Annulohypoxylon bovei var. microspora]